MYWYGPALLETPWKAILYGTVDSVNAIEDNKRGTFFAGELKVEEIIFALPTRKSRAFSAKRLKCNGGFSGLSKGDKVLVFLIEYEGDYAIPDFQGSSCNLGVKLNSFKDPVVNAAKSAARNRVIDKADYSIWNLHDPKGLAYRIEMKEFKERLQD